MAQEISPLSSLFNRSFYNGAGNFSIIQPV